MYRVKCTEYREDGLEGRGQGSGVKKPGSAPKRKGIASWVRGLVCWVLMVVVLFSGSAFAGVEVSPEGRLFIDGLDYTDSSGGTFTFGTNFWHSRFFRTETGLPLQPGWSVDLLEEVAKKLGLSGKGDIKGDKRYAFGQPIITDKFIIATAADCLVIMDWQQQKVTSVSPLLQGSTKRAIYSSPLYIENSSGWFNSDKLPRIVQGTRDGYVYCLRLLPGGTTDIDPEWIRTSQEQARNNPGSPCKGDGSLYTWSNVSDVKHSGLVSSPILIFDRFVDPVKGPIPYLVFGTYNDQVFVLRARNGKPALNAEMDELTTGIQLTGSTGGSAIAFRHSEFPEVFSDFAIGISKSKNERFGEGFVFGGYVRDGQFRQDDQLNEATFKQDPVGRTLYGFPNSVAVAEWHQGGGETNYVLVFADRMGVIYGMDQHTKSFLFRIDKFEGNYCFNTPTIVDDKFALITLSQPGRVVCVDLRKAVELGSASPSRNANEAVYWATSRDDFAGDSFIGSTAFQVLDPAGSESEAIVIAGDESNYSTLPNLKAYYVKQQTGGKEPVPVEGAFFNPADAVNPYSFGVKLPGGIKGEPSFHGDLPGPGGERLTMLAVTDGEGVLHTFSTRILQNLKVNSLVNTQNGQVLETFEEDQEYTLVGMLANETGKKQEAIPLDLTADFGPNPAALPKTLRVFGPDGVQTFDLTRMARDEWDPEYGPEDPVTHDRPKLYDKKVSWHIPGAILGPMGTKVEIDFDTRGVTKNSLTYTLGVNRGPDPKPLYETTYDDNGLSLTLKRGLVDLKVQDLKVYNPRPGKPVWAEFTIKNITDKNPPKWTKAYIYIDNQLKATEDVHMIRPGEELHYGVSLPGVSRGQHTVKVVVNRDQADFEEMNYLNNIVSRSFVADEVQICRGNLLETSGPYVWYIGSEDKYGGNRGDAITADVDDGHGGTKTITIGYQMEWVAGLDYQVYFSTEQLKSGHGFQCRVKVWKTADTTLYNKWFDLEHARMELYGDSGTSSFEYVGRDGNAYVYELVPPTVKNPLRERKHFIPVNFKDGDYRIKICADSFETPGRDLTFEAYDTLTINGHMYMDDVTY